MAQYLTDQPPVRALVEALYGTFDGENDLATAPRFSPERAPVVARALRHDRRDLPDDVLEMLDWCLITTIGTPRTFRHYLPAIVEDFLRYAVAYDTHDMQRFVDKLDMAGFAAWPAAERRPVLAAVKLWFAEKIKQRENLAEGDLPELSAAAVIERTTLADLVDLLDPHRGTPRRREGATHSWSKEVDFLLAAERALAGA